MKLNKSAYLFAAALVASTMGMTSCSSEDEIGVETVAGQETTVTMALSVAPSTRSTADEVNLGDTKNAITNVAVVPMVGTAPQKSVCWESLETDGTSKPQTAQLLSSVNGFRVYGNLTTEQYTAIQGAVPNDIKLTDNMFTLKQSTANTSYKAPHSQLYYYKDVNKFDVSSTGDSWANASDWSTVSTVGSAKYVKVSGIEYAVGILAASVMNGDDSQVFTVGGAKKSASEAGVKVTGIIVNNQRDFKADFTLGDTPYEVYETAASQDFAQSGISVDNAKNGNFYMIAAPTETSDEVNVNIEFLLPEGVTLTKTDGTEVTGAAGTGTKLYLGLKLKGTQAATQNINTVFAADYVTYLNATVKNWGIASETPVTVTDAQIGVVFDVAWKQGNLYNVEI